MSLFCDTFPLTDVHVRSLSFCKQCYDLSNKGCSGQCLELEILVSYEMGGSNTPLSRPFALLLLIAISTFSRSTARSIDCYFNGLGQRGLSRPTHNRIDGNKCFSHEAYSQAMPATMKLSEYVRNMQRR